MVESDSKKSAESARRGPSPLTMEEDAARALAGLKVTQNLDRAAFDIKDHRSKPAGSWEDPKLKEFHALMSEPNSYGQAIVPWEGSNTIPVVAGTITDISKAAEETDEDYGYGMEGLIQPFAEGWDPTAERLFGPTLRLMGIPEIMSYYDMISDVDKRIIPQKLNLVFIAQPAVRRKEKFRASKVNRVGEGPASETFWSHHVRELQVNDSPKAFLEVGVRVISALLPPERRKAHEVVAGWFDKYWNGIGGKFQFMTFWGQTATSFVNLADSPIVRAGRAAGYQAVFAVSRVLLQRVKPDHGVRCYKFTSVDNYEVSEVALVGFWKQHSDDPDDYSLISVANNGRPLGSAEVAQPKQVVRKID